MRQRLCSLLIAVALAGVCAAPASAANKEHQQLMADLRMLQEQSQVLQNLLGTLTDALKAVNTRLDQQAETNRKAFADQKLVVDNLTGDVRIIREKMDDNNVRIGTLTQEVDSLRQSLQQMAARPAPIASDPGTAVAPGTGVPPAASPDNAATTPTPSLNASPTQLWDAAYADYTAGQYDLAVEGFTTYIKTFPKSDRADDAQVLICGSYLNDNKNDKAAQACDLAIRTYPGTNSIPEAYYRKGLALANLKDVAGARAAWEALIKNYPDSGDALLAKQRLDGLKKP
ncbi:MAG TPA: tetratricopeptide repeat protein [Vicinamibacterales bacterium]|jgi:TolA-binding protein